MRSSLLRTILISLGVIVLLVLFGGYSLLWFSVKQQMEVKLAEMKSQGAIAGLTFDYTISGYPLSYVFTLSDVTITPDQERQKRMEALGVPATFGTNYQSFSSKGETVLTVNLLSNKSHLQLPLSSMLRINNNDINIHYATPPKMTLGYDTRNYHLFAQALKLKEEPKGKDILKAIRHFSYEDNGGTIATSLNPRAAAYDSARVALDIDQKGDVVNGDFAFSLVNLATVKGYHQWYYTHIEPTKFPTEAVRDLVVAILEYPLNGNPISYDAKMAFSAPVSGKFMGEIPVNIDIERFSIRDQRGEALHRASIEAYKAQKPVIHGNYALSVEQFPVVLAHYLDVTEMVLNYIRDNEDELRQGLPMSKRAKNLPDAAWISETRTLLEKQLINYFTAIKAMEGDTLKLEVVMEKDQKEPTINGMPAKAAMQLGLMNLQPVMLHLQEREKALKEGAE